MIAIKLPSVTKKQIVAVTGLMLSGFLVGHLSGNLLLFKNDPQAFNDYAEFLTGMRPGFLVVEFGLLAVFLIHVHFAVKVSRENAAARPSRYAVNNDVGDPSLSVKTMIYSGMLVLAFVILHLLQFTFAEKEGEASVINGVNYGLYGLVYNDFSNPFICGGYVIAMVILGMHLNHALQSLIKTVGFNSDKWTPCVQKLCTLIAWVIAIGFALIPLYIFIVRPDVPPPSPEIAQPLQVLAQPLQEAGS
ncbi:MAG: succinate dehydrogenase cytochrome b subunit [Planctomycetota bacterium]